MNSYFNNTSLDFFNKNSPDISTLKQLTDSQVELLFMNPVVNQNGRNHRPSNQEFKNNQDLIFSGCSETQGSYICEENDPDKMHKNIWGFVVSSLLKVKFSNNLLASFLGNHFWFNIIVCSVTYLSGMLTWVESNGV